MDTKHSVGNVTAGLMVVTALLFDGVQALLTASVFLVPFSLFFTILYTIIFGIWFLLLGVYAGRGAEKRLAMSALGAIVEFIPVINALPAVTASVIVTIFLSRRADGSKRKAVPAKKRLASAERLQRMRESSARRKEAAREEREGVEQDRHPAANDDNREEDREAA